MTDEYLFLKKFSVNIDSILEKKADVFGFEKKIQFYKMC